MLVLLVGTGIFLTIRVHFFQISHIKLWMKGTFGLMFRKHMADENITPFQAVSTALASTVGTGNIVGVTTAIVSGGAGALFWMWFAAFFGMVTKYSEVLLSVKYREKNSNGKHFGGPMYYLSKGANLYWLGIIFAVLATLASFGIGNLTQINAMANVVKQNFNIPTIYTGIVITIIVGIVIVGGIKRVGAFAEKCVPIMCIFYIIVGLIIIISWVGALGYIRSFRRYFLVCLITGNNSGYEFRFDKSRIKLRFVHFGSFQNFFSRKFWLDRISDSFISFSLRIFEKSKFG